MNLIDEDLKTLSQNYSIKEMIGGVLLKFMFGITSFLGNEFYW